MRTLTQSSFLKGVNAATSKTTVVQGSVRRISNMVYTRRGGVQTCDGTKIMVTGANVPFPGPWNINPPTIGAAETPCAMIAATAGVAPSFPLLITFANSTTYPFDAWDISNDPPTLLFPAGTFGNYSAYTVPYQSSRLPQLVNVNGLVVMCPGNDVPPVWANFFNLTQGFVGSNVTSGYPVLGAAHGVLHQGALWLWNTGVGNGAVDTPSTLRMCALDANGNPDVTNFPRLNVAFVDPTDGSQGQGCISFTSAEAGISPTATLVLFKDYSTYQVTGLLTPGGGYSITRAQTDMGCVASRSIQFAPGFGIIRLTHFGVSLFDGANDKLISEEIRPYFFQTEPDITAMDWTRASACTSCITVNPPMYCLSIPLPGTGGNSRILCYDLVLKQWTVIDLPGPNLTGVGPINLMYTMRFPGSQPVTYITDWAPIAYPFETQYSAGNVYRWQAGDYQWDGNPATAINWLVKPPPMFSDNPSTPLYVRRANVRASTSNATLNAAFELDNTQKFSVSRSVAYNYLSPQSLYGTARYGGTYQYDAASPDLVIPFDVGYKCWSSSVQLTGTGPIELLAIDWNIEPKAPMPRPRVS